MPKGVHNWTFVEVVRFLKSFGFQHSYTKGSHYFYIGTYNKKLRQVTIPFHGAKAISPKTMKGIIAQSGIPKEGWTSRTSNKHNK